MADKSVFAIELETAEWNRFKKEFDDYHDKLGDTVKQWQDVAKAVNDARSALRGVSTAMRSAAANDNRSGGYGGGSAPRPDINPPIWAKGLGDSMKTASGEMRKLSTSLLRQVGSYGGGGTSSMIGGVEGIIGGMSRSTIVTAVVSMAAAAVSAPLMAAFAAAPEMANLRRQALALGGLNTGTIRATNVAGAWMDNPQAGLANVVAAQRNFTSPQFQAFANIFGLRGAQAEMSKDPGKAQFDFLNKAVETLKGIPKNLQDAFIENYGMTDVFSKATIRAWQAMGGAERAQHQSLFEDTARRTHMSDADAAKWTLFYEKLKAAGEILESALTKRLTKLTGPLGDMSLKFAKWVDDSKLLDTALSELTDNIKTNADQIKATIDFLKATIDWVKKNTGHVEQGAVTPADKAKGAYVDPKTGKGEYLTPPPDLFPSKPPQDNNAKDAKSKTGSWFRNPFHRSAYGDDDFHKYIHKTSDIRELGGKVGSALSENPGASAVGATGNAMMVIRYWPVIKALLQGGGGAALGGVGVAGAVMWPKPAETGELPRKYWPKDAVEKDQLDELKKINDKMDKANIPTAAGMPVSMMTTGAGGGFALPGSGQVVGGGGGTGGAGGSGAFLAQHFGGGGVPRGRAGLSARLGMGRGGGGVGGFGDTSGAISGGASGAEAQVGATKDSPTLANIVADARQRAVAHGVDPDFATGIIMGESGLHKPGDKRGAWGNADPSYSGQAGTSYGPWQLRRPGLGSAFDKAHPGMGLSAGTWKQQNEFAISQIAKHGMKWTRGTWMSIGDAEKRGTNVTAMGKGWMSKYGGALPPGAAAAANGAVGSGGANADFFSSRTGAGVSGKASGLNAQFAGDLESSIREAEKATGEKAKFTSLTRDRATQERLYYNYINHIGGQGLAARPGTSLHERGMAADLAPGKVRDYIRAHAGQHGMELVPGDPEHVQMAKALRAHASDTRLADIKAKDAVTAAAPPAVAPSSAKAQAHRGQAMQGGMQSAMNKPMHLDNWQLAMRSKVELHDKTGSNTHISASTMVG